MRTARAEAEVVLTPEAVVVADERDGAARLELHLVVDQVPDAGSEVDPGSSVSVDSVERRGDSWTSRPRPWPRP